MALGLPAFEASIHDLAERCAVEVTPDSEATPGKTGFAPLAAASTDAAAAVAGAAVIIITAPAVYHDIFVDALIPHLEAGQIILFNTRIGAARDRAPDWVTRCAP